MNEKEVSWFVNFKEASNFPFNPPLIYNIPREKPEILPKKKTNKAVLSFTKLGTSENLNKIKRLTSETSLIQVYLLEYRNTAVMTIPNFQGREGVGNDGVNDYLKNLQLGYDIVRDSNATRLLIDVTNNGGGYVSTATLLTQLLFPKDLFSGFPIQLKANLFAQQLYEKGSWSPKPTGSVYDYRRYVDINGNLIKKAEKFFFPLKNVTHNNHTALYSSLFKHPNLINNVVPNKPLFNESNILLLSNGLCYSTCALFSYQMRQIHKVKVVTIGGKSSNKGPIPFADGAAGFVCEDYNNFYTGESLYQDKKNPHSPTLLPIQGTLKFVLAQSFGPKSSKIPQEFIYEPGQFHLKYTDENVISVEKVWREAAQFFE